MSQQLGPTYLLSVLVVVGCALAFYRGEKPTPPPSPRVAQEQRAEEKQERVVQSERLAAEPIRARLVAESRTAPARAEAKPTVPAEPRPIRVASPASRPSPRVPSARRGAFARTEEGETLEDVSQRVYGTPEKAEALWRANRDQLPSPDAPIAPGMLLRTP
jgi:nucleoid-associated protein YgaU